MDKMEKLEGNGDRVIPDYVCCVVTEAIWTWFGCILLMVVCFGVGTLKYCRSRLRSARFAQANVKLSISAVQVDQRFALDAISKEPIAIADFPEYNRQRQKHRELDNIELARITKAVKIANKNNNEANNESNNTANNTDNKLYEELEMSFIKTSDKDLNWSVCRAPMSFDSAQNLWQMIWQEEIEVIVMVTQIFEHTREMCHQYCPLRNAEQFKEIRVEPLIEESNAHFQIRLFELTNIQNDKKRRVKHYHFTQWTLNQTPAPNLLLQFIHRLQQDLFEFKSSNESPINVLIHCSDGGERSGTFLAIYTALKEARSTLEVNINNVIKELLLQKSELMRLPEHLRYVFDVVEDELVCGQTLVRAADLLSCMQTKGDEGFEQEHALLKSLVPRFTIGSCAAGHRAENRHKNRHVLIVPPDNKRPYLKSFRGNECTDYINAVFVDSYLSIDEFICTEWPQPKTITDLLALINDFQVKCVVVLNKSRRSGRFPLFWPNSDTNVKYSMKSPLFKLSLVKQQEENGVMWWDVMLDRQELSAKALERGSALVALGEFVQSLSSTLGHRFRLFQMQSWPDSAPVPNSTLAMVNLLEAVDKFRSSHNLQRDHTLVISTDGCSRVGVFCVTAMSMDRLRRRGEVDIFQAVKTVQQHRPQLISSVEEYKFCYDTMLHLVMQAKRQHEQ